MQKDSEEEVVSEKTSGVELPFQEHFHFKNFKITYRNAESVEDLKTSIANLEKDASLLFVDTPNSINII